MLKRVMAWLAWTTLAFIAVAQVVQLPTIERRLQVFEGNAFGRAVVVTVLVAWGVSAIGLWVVSIVYAWRRGREGVAPYYPVAVLAVSSFVGSLVYYFAFARGHSDNPRGARSAHSTRSSEAESR